MSCACAPCETKYLWRLDADAEASARAVTVLAILAGTRAITVVHTLARGPDYIDLAGAHRHDRRAGGRRLTRVVVRHVIAAAHRVLKERARLLGAQTGRRRARRRSRDEKVHH